MYTNNAYLNNSTLDIKDKSKPLIVTSCGTYHLYTRPKLPPGGREVDVTFSYFILHPEKHIFTLMEKNKL